MTIPSSLRAMHEAHKNRMTKSNLFYAELDLIEEEVGFNTREYERPEVQEHINNLAEAYLAGDDIPPLRVTVIDGRLLLRDGYCRRRAAIIARDRGAEITRLPIMEVKGDEVEQSLVILTSNDGLKLTPLERAQVYARLVGMNLTEDEVAKRVRKTKTHVQQYLAIHSLPRKFKDYIKSDTIAWSLALEMFQEHGTAAIELIEKQLTLQAASAPTGKKPLKENVPSIETSSEGESESSGDEEGGETAAAKEEAPVSQPKQRITRKSIDAATGYRSRINGALVKSVTDGLGTVIKSLGAAREEGDNVTITLTREQVEELRAIHQELLPGGKKDKKLESTQSEGTEENNDQEEATLEGQEA